MTELSLGTDKASNLEEPSPQLLTVALSFPASPGALLGVAAAREGCGGLGRGAVKGASLPGISTVPH